MNPLTNVKNTQKLNETELELGLVGSKSSWHEDFKDSAWIFVGGLPYDLSEGDVICVFSQYGEIVHINLVRDKQTGKSKGFCFICYEDQRSTILAVDNLNSIKLLGRTLRVNHVAEYKMPKEHEDDDEVTMRLREEGCAPKIVDEEEEGENDEEHASPKKKSKKEKKKNKKKKKKKSNEVETTSEQGTTPEVTSSRLNRVAPGKIKQERYDASYDKYNRQVDRDRSKDGESSARKRNELRIKSESDRGIEDRDHRDSPHGRGTQGRDHCDSEYGHLTQDRDHRDSERSHGTRDRDHRDSEHCHSTRDRDHRDSEHSHSTRDRDHRDYHSDKYRQQSSDREREHKSEIRSSRTSERSEDYGRRSGSSRSRDHGYDDVKRERRPSYNDDDDDDDDDDDGHRRQSQSMSSQERHSSSSHSRDLDRRHEPERGADRTGPMRKASHDYSHSSHYDKHNSSSQRAGHERSACHGGGHHERDHGTHSPRRERHRSRSPLLRSERMRITVEIEK